MVTASAGSGGEKCAAFSRRRSVPREKTKRRREARELDGGPELLCE